MAELLLLPIVPLAIVIGLLTIPQKTATEPLSLQEKSGKKNIFFQVQITRTILQFQKAILKPECRL